MQELENHFLDKAVYVISLVVIFLLPIFFFPVSMASLSVAKITLLALGVLLSLFLISAEAIKWGKITIWKNWAVFASIAVLIVTFISSILSQSFFVSFGGRQVEIGTFMFLFLAVSAFLIIQKAINTKEKLFYSILAIFVSFAVVLAIELVKLFFPSIDITSSIGASIVDKWNDLALLSGLSVIVIVSAFQFLRLSPILRIILGVMAVLFFGMMAVINMTVVWYLIAVTMFIMFAYSLMLRKFEIEKEESGNKFPYLPLVVMIISIIFILIGSRVYDFTSSKLGTYYFEASPSWSSTANLFQKSFIRNPVLGTGPGNFSALWNEYRPVEINSTYAWNINFNNSIGFVPTSIIETGVLGLISWLTFIVSILLYGFSLFFKKGDSSFRFVVSTSVLCAFFLWISSFFYNPGITMIILTFVLSGLVISLYRIEKGNNVYVFGTTPKTSFLSIIISVIFVLILVVISFMFGRQIIASSILQNSIFDFSKSNNYEKLKNNIERANSIYATDTQYKVLSQANISLMGAIIGGKSVDKSAVSQLQTYLSDAISAAQNAVIFDIKNYQNWLALGSVYEAVVPLKVTNSYEGSKASYEQALKLSPTNPTIQLALARLEVANGDDKSAEKYIGEALKLKGDYTDAVMLFAKIRADNGDLKTAITSLETAAVFSPKDSSVFFGLGLLKYNNKDYLGSSKALETAVSLNPNYSNARYYLAIDYNKLNRDSDALTQLNILKDLNPGNAEIIQMISNLNSGKSLIPSPEPVNNTDNTSGSAVKKAKK